MKPARTSPYAKKAEDEEKEIYITPAVIAKFVEEMAKRGNDFQKLLEDYRAAGTRNSTPYVVQYDETTGYERMLRKQGLIAAECFYDLTLPINYFKILLRSSKI